MSLNRIVFVTCDVCFDDYGAAMKEYSAREVRHIAKVAGWHHWRGRDLCPDCFKREKAKKP